MSILADLLSTLFERRNLQDAYRLLTPDKTLDALCRELLSSKGEVSGFQIANEILDRYDAADEQTKLALFRFIADELDIDVAAVSDALTNYGSQRDAPTYATLARACEAPRQELFRRVNQVPGATGRLVKMRAELLRIADKDPSLQRIDLDLRHLFRSWFNRGFLVMRPISWNSPAQILEKIIAYEAVHAIESWEDLRNRVEPHDRRCFAFFHPVMPDEPLIFVEVALTKGIPGSIGGLLDQSREPIATGQADCAVFYSISNCQAGLAGISFGNSLIKQVVEELSHAFPQIKTFVTLSPIPRLVEWAKANGCERALEADADSEKLASHYLLHAKASDGLPFDPVTRFHLNNGAMIHAVHARADTSEKGMAQSAGLMVNYLYDLRKISDNHERFARGETVAASPRINQLAKAFQQFRSELREEPELQQG